jgi:hypothetical protein
MMRRWLAALRGSGKAPARLRQKNDFTLNFYFVFKMKKAPPQALVVLSDKDNKIIKSIFQ